MSTPTHLVRVQDVVSQFVPGSFDQPWSWADERDWLDEQVCLATGIRGEYQRQLERHLSAVGAVEQPICLGDDGRVWDGHHRVVAAIRLGFDSLLAECFCETPAKCSAAPLDVGAPS